MTKQNMWQILRLSMILVLVFAVVGVVSAQDDTAEAYDEAVYTAIDAVINGETTILDLGNSDLEEIPPIVFELTQITYLDLSHQDIMEIPAEIGNLTNLTFLELNYTDITSLPSEIGTLTSLTHLHVRSANLTALPTEIGNLDSLERLDVTYNDLTALPSEIGNLSNLQVLNVSYNDLTELPPEIGNLSNLQVLDVSYNDLRTLPSEIGNLRNLMILRAEDNNFSSIPNTLRNLPNLQRVEVHSSVLRIPVWLEQNMDLKLRYASNPFFFIMLVVASIMSTMLLVKVTWHHASVRAFVKPIIAYGGTMFAVSRLSLFAIQSIGNIDVSVWVYHNHVSVTSTLVIIAIIWGWVRMWKPLLLGHMGNSVSNQARSWWQVLMYVFFVYAGVTYTICTIIVFSVASFYPGLESLWIFILYLYGTPVIALGVIVWGWHREREADRKLAWRSDSMKKKRSEV